MRKSIQASLLMLALAVSSYAGDMQCGVTDTPPPPPASAVQEQPTAGEISTPLTTDGDLHTGAELTFVEVLLNLLALS
jgi:hypothetical protein